MIIKQNCDYEPIKIYREFFDPESFDNRYGENKVDNKKDKALAKKYNAFMSKKKSKISDLIENFNFKILVDRVKYKSPSNSNGAIQFKVDSDTYIAYVYEIMSIDYSGLGFFDKQKAMREMNKLFTSLYNALKDESVSKTLSLTNFETSKDKYTGYVFILYDDSVLESATEIPDEREAFTRYFDVEDVEPSIADIEDDSREEFYRDPVFNKAISEHFNILDKKTRKTLLSLDEAGQNSVVMSLTSKLYDKIVDKCEDIDYGEIPATKGDITKLSKYDSMKETISIMHDLLREYNQNTGPVDELSVAFSNVEARKDLFERAYRYNSELPIAIYCNVVLGIITGISYMIATCIEFIKDPGTENFRISLDKVAYAKSKDHMIYNTLKSFNKTCENKEFDKAMEAVLKTSTKNFGGTVAAGGIAMAVLGTILILIPVLRELIFMFYYMRMKVSDFFDIQADLLQANAYSIEANKTLDKSEQKKIMAKQLKYVANFRKISNAFAIDMKKAEVESDKEKKSDDETKMLIDDIDGIDTGSNGSALF